MTNQSFTIAIFNDSIIEANETVGLILSSPTGGATLGSPASATLVILDNDEPPNNTPATATPLDLTTGFASVSLPSGAVPAAISPVGDEDWYSFTAPAGARLWAVVDTGGAQNPGANSRDSVLTLYATNGTTVIEEDDDDGSGNGCDSTLELDGGLASAIAGRTLATGGTYYLRVKAFGTNQIIDPFQLFVVVTITPGSAEIEPNGSSATATPLLTTKSPIGFGLGQINVAGDVDYYSVVAPSNAVLQITADGNPERDATGTDLMVDLISIDGTSVLFSADSSGSGTNAAEGFCFKAPRTGTYFVRVRHASPSGTGTYGLTVARDRSDLVITGLERAGGDMRVRFATTPAKNYRVDSADKLKPPGPWTQLPGTVIGNGGIMPFLDVGGAGQAQRYYRVRQLP